MTILVSFLPGARVGPGLPQLPDCFDIYPDVGDDRVLRGRPPRSSRGEKDAGNDREET